jgi:hypothetical protein
MDYIKSPDDYPECNICTEKDYPIIDKECCSFDICKNCIQRYTENYCPHCKRQFSKLLIGLDKSDSDYSIGINGIRQFLEIQRILMLDRVFYLTGGLLSVWIGQNLHGNGLVSAISKTLLTAGGIKLFLNTFQRYDVNLIFPVFG